MKEPKEKPRLTPDGLPVITQDSVDLFFIDINKRGRAGGIEASNAYLDGIKERILGENPALENMIQTLTATMPEGLKKYSSMINKIFMVAVVATYELLRKQAEANNLEEGYKPK